MPPVKMPVPVTRVAAAGVAASSSMKTKLNRPGHAQPRQKINAVPATSTQLDVATPSSAKPTAPAPSIEARIGKYADLEDGRLHVERAQRAARHDRERTPDDECRPASLT
jgi:hypothetical protein